MNRILAFVFGLAAYIVFLGTFLYAIGFVAGVVVPKSIDTGPVMPVLQSVVINVLLLTLFAVQHSVMARKPFKRWWTRFIPKAIERSMYVLLASLALILLFWLWQPIHTVVWHVTDPATEAVLFGLSLFGWAIVLFSTFLINHFELFGLRQVMNESAARSVSAPTFRTPLLYNLVRHPIYVGFIIAFWATPVMTCGHLLFATVTTAYILIGIALEERDLIDAFGDEYRRYRRRVGMLLPMRPRRSMFRTAAETEMTPDTPFTTLNKCNRAIRYDGAGPGSSDDPNLRTVECGRPGVISRLPAWGLLLVVATAVGWGLGWPMMRIAMHDWPPLFARGCAGLAAALGLAIIAMVRGQNLLPSRSLAPRLALGAATNVFAPMGFTALALLWLTVAQAALLTFSMPIWATLLAWPILGERPRLRSVIALCLGVAGLVLLMGQNLGGGIETFPGVALALAAAILFALGAVTSRAPIPLPPMVSTAWLIGLGSAAMIVVGLTLNGSDIKPLSFAGAGALVYMAVCPMALCYLSWFAALERVPAATASTGLLLVPVVGALSAAAILGEALGFREICAFVLTLGGVALELRGRR